MSLRDGFANLDPAPVVALALDGGFIDKASLEAFFDRVMTRAARPAEPLTRSPLIPVELEPGGLIRLAAPGSDGAVPSPWVPGAAAAAGDER